MVRPTPLFFNVAKALLKLGYGLADMIAWLRSLSAALNATLETRRRRIRECAAQNHNQEMLPIPGTLNKGETR